MRPEVAHLTSPRVILGLLRLNTVGFGLEMCLLGVDVTGENLLIPSLGNYFCVVKFNKTHHMDILEGIWL